MSKETKQDQISVLLDDILLHILSFLEMKQVLKTSVLSKRWELIWTFLPKLTFEQSGSEKEAPKFVACVHKTLLSYRNTRVEKLNISFNYDDCFVSDVDAWARFALHKEVRDLRLDFIDFKHPAVSDNYSLPRSIYSNKFLINLSICCCKLSPKLGVSWACLKYLSMTFVKLNDDTIAKIFSGSPILKVLKIEKCWGFNCLNINSESLQELVLKGGYIADDFVLEISAPNLQYLNILGDYHKIIQFRIREVSSLFKAELNFNFLFKDEETKRKKQYGYLIELINCFHHVKELRLGGACIQALALLLVEERTLSSPFTHLTCLKVDAFIDQHVATGIISLLNYSPNLEKLIVRRPHDKLYWPSSAPPTEIKEYWESGRMIEKLSLPCLSSVKFHGSNKLGDIIGGFTPTLLKVLRENRDS